MRGGISRLYTDQRKKNLWRRATRDIPRVCEICPSLPDWTSCSSEPIKVFTWVRLVDSMTVCFICFTRAVGRFSNPRVFADSEAISEWRRLWSFRNGWNCANLFAVRCRTSLYFVIEIWKTQVSAARLFIFIWATYLNPSRKDNLCRACMHLVHLHDSSFILFLISKLHCWLVFGEPEDPGDRNGVKYQRTLTALRVWNLPNGRS